MVESSPRSATRYVEGAQLKKAHRSDRRDKFAFLRPRACGDRTKSGLFSDGASRGAISAESEFLQKDQLTGALPGACHDARRDSERSVRR